MPRLDPLDHPPDEVDPLRIVGEYLARTVGIVDGSPPVGDFAADHPAVTDQVPAGRGDPQGDCLGLLLGESGDDACEGAAHGGGHVEALLDGDERLPLPSQDLVCVPEVCDPARQSVDLPDEHRVEGFRRCKQLAPAWPVLGPAVARRNPFVGEDFCDLPTVRGGVLSARLDGPLDGDGLVLGPGDARIDDAGANSVRWAHPVIIP